jgi:uncharacterized protein YegL
MTLQQPLESVEFADNPEPRCPLVLVLDTSSSMSGDPIQELNQGLKEFAEAVRSDPLVSLRVEVAIVTFGGTVQALDVKGAGGAIPFDAEQAFVTVDAFAPPVLVTSGATPMGEAVRRALSLIRDRKAIYRRDNIDYFRPWMFLITDGHPTDFGWQAAADEIRAEEARKGVTFYAVGVEGADLQVLSRFSDQRPPVRLKGLAFRELFQWLSKSVSVVAQSRPGEQVPLPPVGWGQVDTSHS